MNNIIWISEYNQYLIKNNINLDIYDYIDYIADKVGGNCNNGFIKYLLKLDISNISDNDNLNNRYCITSNEFSILKIKNNKDIKKLIKKTNLVMNRDYIIKIHKKKFLNIFEKTKIKYYLHPYAFKMCLLTSGQFNIYFITLLLRFSEEKLFVFRKIFCFKIFEILFFIKKFLLSFT